MRGILKEMGGLGTWGFVALLQMRTQVLGQTPASPFPSEGWGRCPSITHLMLSLSQPGCLPAVSASGDEF